MADATCHMSISPDGFVARPGQSRENLYGPLRGEWDEDCWDGWWGSESPCQAPIVALTRDARAPIEIEGGTRFHVVTQSLQLEPG
ncbi:MAG: hypothetical protein R2725_08785 [Solirubrobacterales bacterium]